MAVTPEDVRRVAELARLELSDEEVEGLVRDLGDILGHVDVLQAIEIDEHRGSRIEHRASNIEDRASSIEHPGSGDGDALFHGPETFAPDFRDGFFRVPRLTSHSAAGAGGGSGLHQGAASRERPDGSAVGDTDGKLDADLG